MLFWVLEDDWATKKGTYSDISRLKNQILPNPFFNVGKPIGIFLKVHHRKMGD